MELLDRYLQAVKKYLPKRQQDDIIKELSENLLSQIEDQEAELGRSLTEGELAALLRSHGQPLLVAIRYRPQRYLIGPAIFPFYWFILKITVVLAVAFYSVINAVPWIAETPTMERLVQLLDGIPHVAWTAAASVTLCFVAIEFFTTHYNIKLNCFDDWDPRSLPQLDKISQKRTYHPIYEFLANLVFALWMLVVPYYPVLIFGPGAVYFKRQAIQLAPVWHSLYWPLMALLFTTVIVRAMHLFPFSWKWPWAVIDLIFKASSLVFLGILARAHEYFILGSTPVDDLSRSQGLVTDLNSIGFLSCRIVAIIVTLQVFWEAGKMVFESLRGRSSYMAMKL